MFQRFPIHLQVWHVDDQKIVPGRSGAGTSSFCMGEFHMDLLVWQPQHDARITRMVLEMVDHRHPEAITIEGDNFAEFVCRPGKPNSQSGLRLLSDTHVETRNSWSYLLR